MGLQNQCTQIFARATTEPIVLISDRCQESLVTKNTFLDFDTDENKAIKSSAFARSTSADSALARFKADNRPQIFPQSPDKRSWIFSTETECSTPLLQKSELSTQTTATPTNRSASPSNSSSSDLESYAGFQSPDSTPRANSKGSATVGGSFPVMVPSFMMPIMMPMMMPLSPKEPMSPWCKEPTSPKEPVSPKEKGSETRKERNLENKEDIKTMVVSLNQLLESPGGGLQTTDTSVKRRSSVANVFMFSEAPAPNAELETTPRVENRIQKLRQPQVIKPRSKQDNMPGHGKAGKRQDLKKLKTTSTEMTLMMRGIPCSFSQEDLMTLIDDAGLKGKYNFFYLPYDGKKNRTTLVNLGYCFINFVDKQSADLCASTFTGVPLMPFRSPKTCRVSPADIQGLSKLWDHFRNKAVNGAGLRGPMFFNL